MVNCSMFIYRIDVEQLCLYVGEKMKTKKMTEFSMFLAVSLVLSYLESLLPVIFFVPGLKIGLANILTLIILYRLNWKWTIFFMTLRVTLAGFLFSGVTGIIYSFFGGLFCILAMQIAKQCPFFSTLGVSVIGAVFHNLGQIVIAVCLLENIHVFYYFPVLCCFACVTGVLIGYLAYWLLKKYNQLFFKD